MEELQEATAVESPQTVSQFPRDLEVTNNILNMSLDFFMSDLESNPENPLPLSTVRSHVFDR